MSDSTKSDNIDQLDAGSARWQLATRYNPTDDTHKLSAVTIDWEHQMVHEGDGYSISGKITSLGAGATSYLLAKNQNGAEVHWRTATVVVEDGPVDLYFYESPTTTADGSELTSYNKDRGSANTPALDVFSGPTVSAVGTELEHSWIPPTGGTGGRNIGGTAERVGGEWILAASTDYLVQITNNSGTTIDLSYYFFWYEL